MYYKSKKISLLILAATALVFTRTTLVLFDDPEGPNLLVVVGLASVVFLLSLTAYLFKVSISDFRRISLAILIQILLLVGFYYNF